MKTYVIIPAYQPDQRLIELVQQLSLKQVSIVVVDDGSGPAYHKIFNQLEAVYLVQYPQNHGKGYALKRGFQSLSHFKKPFVVVTCDADGQHSVADIIHIGNQAKKEPEALILGKRTFKQDNVPLRSRLGNQITAKVFGRITGAHVSDTQTGLRAFSAQNLDQMITIQGEAYDYEMNVLMAFAKEKKEIIEIPIQTIYHNDNEGSHFNAVKDSFKIYLEILKYAASSLISFAVDFALYSLFLSTFSVIGANVLARVLSASLNFTINRKYVFKGDEKTHIAAFKYTALAASVLLVNSLLLTVLTQTMGLNALVSKVIVEMSLFILNGFVQKKIVFRKRKAPCIEEDIRQ